MQTIELIILIIFILFVGIVLFYLHKQNKNLAKLAVQKEQPLELVTSWLQDIRSSMTQNTDLMFRQLDSTNHLVSQRIDYAANLMQGLNQDIGKIHQISQQIQNFEYILRTPHLRGQIGERALTDLLQQSFPQSHVKTQYKFRNNSIVDVILETAHGKLPIDSKFPMENFINLQKERDPKSRKVFEKDFFRDVARHIEAISKKYINPAEGTTEFALMYVPSENIYYQVISNEKLVLYSERNNVLLVSPNNFYYFLKIILLGLEGEKIEEKTSIILQEFGAFEQAIIQAEKELQILTTHINNAQNAGDRLNQIFVKIDKKVKEVKNW